MTGKTTSVKYAISIVSEMLNITNLNDILPICERARAVCNVGERVHVNIDAAEAMLSDISWQEVFNPNLVERCAQDIPMRIGIGGNVISILPEKPFTHEAQGLALSCIWPAQNGYLKTITREVSAKGPSYVITLCKTVSFSDLADIMNKLATQERTSAGSMLHTYMLYAERPDIALKVFPSGSLRSDIMLDAKGQPKAIEIIDADKYIVCKQGVSELRAHQLFCDSNDPEIIMRIANIFGAFEGNLKVSLAGQYYTPKK